MTPFLRDAAVAVMTIVSVIGLGLVVFGGLSLISSAARCDQWCVPTYCSNSAQCHGGCVCAIPDGRTTGYCTGTR